MLARHALIAVTLAGVVGSATSVYLQETPGGHDGWDERCSESGSLKRDLQSNDSGGGGIRSLALSDAAKCGPLAAWAFEDIVEILRDGPNYVIRENAARTLGEIGGPRDATIQALLEASGGPSDELGTIAAQIIAWKIGRPALPALFKALDQDAWEDPNGFELKPRWKNARTALVKMADRGGPNETREEILPAILEGLTGSDDQVEGILEALHGIAFQRTNAAGQEFRGLPRMAAPALLGCLSPSRRSDVRANAAALIGTMGQIPAAVPALTAALEDEQVRVAAAAALGQMGEVSAPAIPALERVAQSQDRQVAGVAKEAIERIRDACHGQ